MNSTSLLLAFLEVAPDADAASAEPELASALQARVDAGRAAWPDLPLDPSTFVKHLSAHADGARLPPLEHAAEMWLACACAHGVAGAAERFDQAYRAVVERAAQRVDARLRDEVTQSVLASLLVREASAPPRLAQYGGRSRLATWLTTIATRAALRQRGAPARDEESVSALADAARQDAPDLALTRARHAADFERALRDALRGLALRERMLLRLHYAQEWSIDRLGTFYGVGRSTAARWVARARETLFEACRALLVERLGLTSSEFRSLAALLQSHLQASLVRLLEEDAPPRASDVVRYSRG